MILYKVPRLWKEAAVLSELSESAILSPLCHLAWCSPRSESGENPCLSFMVCHLGSTALRRVRAGYFQLKGSPSCKLTLTIFFFFNQSSLKANKSGLFSLCLLQSQAADPRCFSCWSPQFEVAIWFLLLPRVFPGCFSTQLLGTGCSSWSGQLPEEFLGVSPFQWAHHWDLLLPGDLQAELKHCF